MVGEHVDVSVSLSVVHSVGMSSAAVAQPALQDAPQAHGRWRFDDDDGAAWLLVAERVCRNNSLDRHYGDVQSVMVREQYRRQGIGIGCCLTCRVPVPGIDPAVSDRSSQHLSSQQASARHQGRPRRNDNAGYQHARQYEQHGPGRFALLPALGTDQRVDHEVR